MLKLGDQVSFHLNIPPTVKNLDLYILFGSNEENPCLCCILFYILVVTTFRIFKQHFHWFLPNYMEFSHPISPRTSEKYDSTFGTKITVCLKKFWGMMLWIMSGTFNMFLGPTMLQQCILYKVKHFIFSNSNALLK